MAILLKPFKKHVSVLAADSTSEAARHFTIILSKRKKKA